MSDEANGKGGLLDGFDLRSVVLALAMLGGGGAIGSVASNRDGPTAKEFAELKAKVDAGVEINASEFKHLDAQLGEIKAALKVERRLVEGNWTRTDHEKFDRKIAERFESLEKRVLDLEKERSK